MMLISFAVKEAFFDHKRNLFQYTDYQCHKGNKIRWKNPISGGLKKIFLLKNLVYKINYFTFVSN